jgi:pimeloyl-ACP methyl ester carboxylesterase
MPNIAANGIQIEYETFGDRSSPALLLIVGLGCQLIYWDDPLCRKLAYSGLFVIRFDNRDNGLSTRFENAGEPDLKRIMEGRSVSLPYTLADMADDAAGLLEALDIAKAHICGISMGALIAQIIAIRHSSKTLSLVSIYSPTNNPDLPPPDPRAMSVFFEPVPFERQAYIDRLVRDFRILAGPGFSFDEPWHRHLAAQAFDRGFYPPGISRNMAASMAYPTHKAALGSVSAPTLVIHGSDDPIVPVAAGKDIAASVPNAELMIVEGMGHDLPHDGPWVQIVDRIIALTGKIRIKNGKPISKRVP